MRRKTRREVEDFAGSQWQIKAAGFRDTDRCTEAAAQISLDLFYYLNEAEY